MLLGSGLRAVFGVCIKPMETTFGWDRAARSGAAAISLLLLGAAGPFVGWLADQWGPRRVIFLSAILLGLGAMLSARVSALWQIYITCGVLMGLGPAGGGMSPGPARPPRWFKARPGLGMGLVGGPISSGQFWIVPPPGWFTPAYAWR